MTNTHSNLTAKIMLGLPLGIAYTGAALLTKPITETIKGAHEGSLAMRESLAKFAAGLGALMGILGGVGLAYATGYYAASGVFGFFAATGLASQGHYNGEEAGRSIGATLGAFKGLFKGIFISPLYAFRNGQNAANNLVDSLWSPEVREVSTETTLCSSGACPVDQKAQISMAPKTTMTTQFDTISLSAKSLSETVTSEEPQVTPDTATTRSSTLSTAVA